MRWERGKAAKSFALVNWPSSAMTKSRISVILPGWNSHHTIAACLESLRQQTLPAFEVIVVDSSPNGETETLVRKQFPEVHFRRSAERLLPHMARNLGSTLAQGDILVFSDPDCRMSPEWLQRLANAQEKGHAVVGGAVSNLESDWFLDGVHLCKYGWWLPGGMPGFRPDMPSANVSYSKDVFARVGPFPDEWCGDTLLAQRALAGGDKPWFEPEALIFHDHRTTWSEFLRERFQRGYDYGSVRPRLEHWSRARKLGYALAAPLIALLMLARGVGYSVTTGNLGLLLKCLPVVLAGLAARALGEAKAHWRAAWQLP